MTRGQHRRPGQGVRDRLAKFLGGRGSHRNQTSDDEAMPVRKPSGTAVDGRHRSRGTAA